MSHTMKVIEPITRATIVFVDLLPLINAIIANITGSIPVTQQVGMIEMIAMTRAAVDNPLAGFSLTAGLVCCGSS